MPPKRSIFNQGKTLEEVGALAQLAQRIIDLCASHGSAPKKRRKRKASVAVVDEATRQLQDSLKQSVAAAQASSRRARSSRAKAVKKRVVKPAHVARRTTAVQRPVAVAVGDEE